MIEICNVEKRFDDVHAIINVSLKIEEKTVYGLLGTNGAGKSTLLRMMAGVLKPGKGKILLDGKKLYNHAGPKSKCFYVSDDQYFYPNSSAQDMEKTYRTYYPAFDRTKFKEYIEHFHLPYKRRIATFSKGMKKQLAIFLAICSGCQYIFLDETFDGLDPVVRQAMKKIFAAEMEERGLTVVIASHNLRELEDICDQVGLLHQGGLLLSRNLDGLKSRQHRLQLVADDYQEEQLRQLLDVAQYSSRGRMKSLTVRGDAAQIEDIVKKMNPLYYELLPLSLEEIFISETEGIGYDVRNIIQ